MRTISTLLVVALAAAFMVIPALAQQPARTLTICAKNYPGPTSSTWAPAECGATFHTGTGELYAVLTGLPMSARWTLFVEDAQHKTVMRTTVTVGHEPSVAGINTGALPAGTYTVSAADPTTQTVFATAQFTLSGNAPAAAPRQFGTASVEICQDANSRQGVGCGQPIPAQLAWIAIRVRNLPRPAEMLVVAPDGTESGCVWRVPASGGTYRCVTASGAWDAGTWQVLLRDPRGTVLMSTPFQVAAQTPEEAYAAYKDAHGGVLAATEVVVTARLGQWEEALTHAQALASSADATDAYEGHLLLVTINEAKKDYPAALKAVDDVFAFKRQHGWPIGPGDYGAKIGVLLGACRVDEAQQVLLAALGEWPTSEGLHHRAVTLEQRRASCAAQQPATDGPATP